MAHETHLYTKPSVNCHSSQKRQKQTNSQLAAPNALQPFYNCSKNRRKMRRNLATQMGRRKFRKQNSQHNSREKQQPQSRPPKQQTMRHLQNTPKDYGERIFSTPNMPVDHFGALLSHQRKLLAHKLSNSRFLKIHFHTFRY